MLESVTADYADENGFVVDVSRSPSMKQRVVFGMMTDPNPNHELTFSVRDRAVMNSNARRIERWMTFVDAITEDFREETPELDATNRMLHVRCPSHSHRTQ